MDDYVHLTPFTEEGKLKRNLEIAKNLLDVLDNETIAVKTGLSIEAIEIVSI